MKKPGLLRFDSWSFMFIGLFILSCTGGNSKNAVAGLEGKVVNGN